MGEFSQAESESDVSWQLDMIIISIMRNRSQDRHAGKLLMEFNRNEEVPKLVTIHEASRSKDARNKLLMQARTQLQPYKRS